MRAGKGTIQCRLTIQVYEEEIDRRYAEVEEGLLTSGISLPPSTEPQDLIPFLGELCSQTLLDDDNRGDIGIDDDLLGFGLDSLSAFILLARLRAALRKHGVEAQRVQTIDSKLLYASKTIRQLAGKLSQVLATTGTLSGPVQQDFDHATIRLLAKYDTELQGIIKTNAEQIVDNPSTQIVVLTGSTGSLGSYILSFLLARSDVKKVICLNRSGDAKAQSTSLTVRGLPEFNIDSERVKFL